MNNTILSLIHNGSVPIVVYFRWQCKIGTSSLNLKKLYFCYYSEMPLYNCLTHDKHAMDNVFASCSVPMIETVKRAHGKCWRDIGPIPLASGQRVTPHIATTVNQFASRTEGVREEFTGRRGVVLVWSPTPLISPMHQTRCMMCIVRDSCTIALHFSPFVRHFFLHLIFYIFHSPLVGTFTLEFKLARPRSAIPPLYMPPCLSVFKLCIINLFH